MVRATPEILLRIGRGAAVPTPFLFAMQQLLLFFAETYSRVFSFSDPPLHDPCAVAYVIAPQLFKVGTPAVLRYKEVMMKLTLGEISVPAFKRTHIGFPILT